MEVSLHQEIIDFFANLPNIYNSDGRQALMFKAGLDNELLQQIKWELPSVQFFPHLVTTLIQYGQLHDGRFALQAVLEAAKSLGGREKQTQCDTLLQKIQSSTELQIASTSEECEQQPFTTSEEREQQLSTMQKYVKYAVIVTALSIFSYIVVPVILNFGGGEVGKTPSKKIRVVLKDVSDKNIYNKVSLKPDQEEIYHIQTGQKILIEVESDYNNITYCWDVSPDNKGKLSPVLPLKTRSLYIPLMPSEIGLHIITIEACEKQADINLDTKEIKLQVTKQNFHE